MADGTARTVDGTATDEPLLDRSHADRFCLFPLDDDKRLWSMYKKAQTSFWVAEEVDLASDVRDWRESLNEDERHFIAHVLAFFATGDGIVNENLATRFCSEVTHPEARCFYGFQIAIENVHAEMYSLMIDVLIRDPAERLGLFRAIETVPAIRDKAEWALRWIESPTASFADRLVAFAVVEGIFFSSSFCAIFWLKKKGLMAGLGQANELIARDEGLHTDFACLLYSKLRHRSPNVRDIVREAVAIEERFVREALRVPLIGMNETTMCQYVRFVADRLVHQLEPSLGPLFGDENPYAWMTNISVEGKANFFERRETNYAHSRVRAERSDATTGLGPSSSSTSSSTSSSRRVEGSSTSAPASTATAAVAAATDVVSFDSLDF